MKFIVGLTGLYISAYLLMLVIGKIIFEPNYMIRRFDSSVISKTNVGNEVSKRLKRSDNKKALLESFKQIDYPQHRIFDDWIDDDFIIISAGINNFNDGYRMFFVPNYRTFFIFSKKDVSLLYRYTLFTNKIGVTMIDNGTIYHQVQYSNLNKTDKDEVWQIKLRDLSKKR